MFGLRAMEEDTAITVIVMAILEAYTQSLYQVYQSNKYHLGMLKNALRPWQLLIQVVVIRITK
jgi:hypothetical protein